MRPETITLEIFENYPAEKLAEIAQQMASAQSQLEEVEQEKKVSDSAYKERINKFSADVSSLAKRYNKRGEPAQVSCDIRYDNPEPGKKSYYRMDRSELVETHEMTWEERQETIQFPLAEAAPAEAPAADNTKPAPPDDLEKALGLPLCPFPGCVLPQNHAGDHDVTPPPTDWKVNPRPEDPPRPGAPGA